MPRPSQSSRFIIKWSTCEKLSVLRFNDEGNWSVGYKICPDII
jgi:hypothetical protein